jgi:hypothetical protein
VNEYKYHTGDELRSRRCRAKRYVIENMVCDDGPDRECTYYVRAVLGRAPYGPAQPRSEDQLDRLYIPVGPS